MNAKFADVVDSLASAFDELMHADPRAYADLPSKLPQSGVYLFSEGPRHLYVGRSRNIRRRLGGHCRPASNYRKAAFAFRLAREATGHVQATYRSAGSRKALAADPVFHHAFEAAKRRISVMDVRCVEIAEPLKLTLFEVYVAVVLGTPYNDFDTH